MAAEEGGEAACTAQYIALKAFDPDSFYVSGALAVRSELCTRESERIVRQGQADDVAASGLSSVSSDSDRSGFSHASTKNSIKRKKGKQPKAQASSAADRPESSAQRQEQPKPKITKAAAQLAAANRALAESEAALALAAAEAEAEKSSLLDRIRALETSEANEGDRLGVPSSISSYSSCDHLSPLRRQAQGIQVLPRRLLPPV